MSKKTDTLGDFNNSLVYVFRKVNSAIKIDTQMFGIFYARDGYPIKNQLRMLILILLS